MTREERLARVPAGPCYRLMAVDLPPTGQWIGFTASLSLQRDIDDATGDRCRPLYAVFVRPH